MAGRARSTVKFQHKLVLNQWLIGLFGVKDFKELVGPLNDERLEFFDDTESTSRFCQNICSYLHERARITKEEMEEFDQNITRHTQSLNKDRRKDEKIRWKYFQYLALLFTEIYFDRYFRDADSLQENLNDQVRIYNKHKAQADYITKFEASDLRRIAFFQATGSGKTLQMHVNIKQYLHYLRKHKLEHKLNRIILLTPNEGLSKQHLEEFKKSGMREAVLFEKEGRRGINIKRHIEIIDIHKLAEKSGEKTVAVESFEGNNLVLVDEGHRGSSGEEWMKRRRALTKDGFTIEYSATFEQAVATNAGKKLEQQYAKSILFNYSYSYFYSDGYGKDYKILNLDDTTDEDDTKRRRYLTACLLTFYQQMRFFVENPLATRKSNIEKPLLVLVGGKVNAVRTEQRRPVSDIMEYLIFLGNFIKDRERSIDEIKAILEGSHGMYVDGKNVFSEAFDYLQKSKKNSVNFSDMKQRLFNSEHGFLMIEHLKGSDGELALRLGDAEPFGVINVGDAARLAGLCKDYGGDAFEVRDREFSDSHFRHIDKAGSSINILMGSKKFTEGWSSWRVSTMGLMNIGKSEGSEIIQLFGRGVRLKGRDFNLKRSSGEDNDSRHIKKLETLNIFGVRASYMEQFDKFLKKEDLPEKNLKKIVLPVLCHDITKQKKLKVIRLKKGMNYKKDAPCPVLKAEKKYFRDRKIIVNWYPKIQAKISLGAESSSAPIGYEENCFQEWHLAFLDTNQIFFDIEAYKSQHEWHNIILPKEKIKEILLDCSLYKIQIPKERMVFDKDMSEDISRWQEIATVLLKKYVERFYKFRRTKWEHNYLEYRTLEKNDTNLLWSEDANDHQYIVSIEKDKENIIQKIERLCVAINKKEFETLRFDNFSAFRSSGHLYEPIIYLGKGVDYIKIKPVALNKGERIFVEDLTNYIRNSEESFLEDKKLYLLRNQGRGNGIGFFEEGGFYPDFILWIIWKDRQYISFIDPHGLRQASWDDAKLKFYKTIKEIERKLTRSDNSITLNSFIISTTPSGELQWGKGCDFKERNVFFQNEKSYIEDIVKKILNVNS